MLTRPQLLISSAQDFALSGELSTHDRLTLFGDGVGQADVGTWDTRFMCHIGNRSQIDRHMKHSAWPLPDVTNAEELFQAASERGMLRYVPEPGDLFIAWSPAKERFVRSGVVVGIESTSHDEYGRLQHDCLTIEGDLNERSDARGGRVFWVRRELSIERGDRFVHWSHALPSLEEMAA